MADKHPELSQAYSQLRIALADLRRKERRQQRMPQTNAPKAQTMAARATLQLDNITQAIQALQ